MLGRHALSCPLQRIHNGFARLWVNLARAQQFGYLDDAVSVGKAG